MYLARVFCTTRWLIDVTAGCQTRQDPSSRDKRVRGYVEGDGSHDGLTQCWDYAWNPLLILLHEAIGLLDSYVSAGIGHQQHGQSQCLEHGKQAGPRQVS